LQKPKHVSRLEIAVDDAATVCTIKRIGNLSTDFQDLVNWKRTLRKTPC
jgi:Arc/MetJ family transcription regulator